MAINWKRVEAEGHAEAKSNTYQASFSLVKIRYMKNAYVRMARGVVSLCGGTGKVRDWSMHVHVRAYARTHMHTHAQT